MKNRICGTWVCLERLQPDHINQYLSMFSPKVRALLRVKAVTSERLYLQHKIHDESAFFYVIKERSSNHVVGAIEIRNPGYRSQLYCWINERWWGSGCFQEALTLALAYYFSHASENEVYARVDCSNHRSYHALKKVGFLSRGIFNGPEGKQYQLVRKR